MSPRVAALALVALVGCGARRAPPEPAFAAPLGVEIPALAWTPAGLQGVLRIRNTSPFPLSVVGVDWSAGPVEVTGQGVGRALAPGATLDLSLAHGAPRPALSGPLHVEGTVHTRGAGGIRGAEVFRAMAPASPPEIP